MQANMPATFGSTRAHSTTAARAPVARKRPRSSRLRAHRDEEPEATSHQRDAIKKIVEALEYRGVGSCGTDQSGKGRVVAVAFEQCFDRPLGMPGDELVLRHDLPCRGRSCLNDVGEVSLASSLLSTVRMVRCERDVRFR